MRRPNAHPRTRQTRREEAEVRNAKTPLERTRAYRRRLAKEAA